MVWWSILWVYVQVSYRSVLIKVDSQFSEKLLHWFLYWLYFSVIPPWIKITIINFFYLLCNPLLPTFWSSPPTILPLIVLLFSSERMSPRYPSTQAHHHSDTSWHLLPLRSDKIVQLQEHTLWANIIFCDVSDFIVWTQIFKIAHVRRGIYRAGVCSLVVDLDCKHTKVCPLPPAFYLSF